MKDLLFIGMEEWDEVWRRSQNLAARMARRFPDRKILFVGLAVDLSHALRKGRLRKVLAQWRPEPPRALPDLPNVFTFNPVKLFPNTLTPGRLANERLARGQIGQAAARLGIERPLLWIKPHYGAHLVGRMEESFVVYDVGDDWTAFYPSGPLRRRAHAEDEYLTRKADAVIVVSQTLLASKRRLRDVVHLIPNGADIEQYARVGDRALEPHPLAKGWAHPVIGHTGTLHPERTDIDLIVAVARAYKTGTIPLVGPSLLEREAVRRLEAEPNIRLTGPVPYPELPRVMTAFDVCFVPQKVTPFTESQNPLKMFEYLASGLPTVTTPISGFRDYPDLVYLAAQPADFIAAVSRALSEPEDLRSRRRLAVAGQSWDSRVDDILQVCAGAEAS